jgi:hypothetical protein
VPLLGPTSGSLKDASGVVSIIATLSLIPGASFLEKVRKSKYPFYSGSSALIAFSTYC